MEPLTDAQQRILTWIESFIHQHGMPPTVREIGAQFHIKSSSVFGHLKRIERKGYIRRGELGSRSLILPGRKPPKVTDVPLVGCIAAGIPLLAEECIEGSVPVPKELLPRGQGVYFGLRVRGDSMIEAGIFDGDLAIVRKQAHARDGEIVVALLEDEATLKRFRRVGRQIRLEPANRRMKPIVVKDLSIQGVLKMLIRQIR